MILDRSFSDDTAENPNSGNQVTVQKYDRVTVAFHWLTAGLVLALFLIAQGWGFLDRADRAPLKLTHTSLGVVLAALILARIVWRLFFGNRLVAANTGLPSTVARLGHFLLYVLIVLQVGLGFLIGWSGRNAAINAFGFQIPSPLSAFTRDEHNFFEETHNILAWSIIALAGVHASAALFHHYVLRDGLLWRMRLGRGV
jgi:cytochrome b561